MSHTDPIKTIIVENDRAALCVFKAQLEMFPEIDVRGYTSQYHQAKRLLLTEKPELAFIDIDLEGKSGFELLSDVRSFTTSEFSVIFFTNNERLVIRALRESAFDCLLKPIGEIDLRESIKRFKDKRDRQIENSKVIRQTIMYVTEMISLPTHIGIRFVDLGKIVLFHCSRECSMDKPCWEVLLNDEEHIKLKRSTTSREISKLVKDKFIQINPAVIINLNYIDVVEFKTQECVLIAPFQHLRFKISRSQMCGLREKYDVL